MYHNIKKASFSDLKILKSRRQKEIFSIADVFTIEKSVN